MKELHSVLETDHKEIMEYYTSLKEKLDNQVEILRTSSQIKSSLKENIITEIEIMYLRHAEILQAHEHIMTNHHKESPHADQTAFQKMHHEHESIKVEHDLIRSEMLEKLEELKVLVQIPAK